MKVLASIACFLGLLSACTPSDTSDLKENGVTEIPEQEAAIYARLETLIDVYRTMGDEDGMRVLRQLGVMGDTLDGGAAEVFGAAMVDELLLGAHQCRFITDLRRLKFEAVPIYSAIVAELTIRKGNKGASPMVDLLEIVKASECEGARSLMVSAALELARQSGNPFDTTFHSQFGAPSLIRVCYKGMLATKSRDDSLLLHQVMPNTFADFNALFGYPKDHSIGTPGGPLTDMYAEIVTAMLATDVGYKERVRTILGLSVDGWWDADAVALLQQELIDVLRTEPHWAAHELSMMTEEQQRSIGRFLYDGPHIKLSRINDIAGLKEHNKVVYSLMLDEFNKRIDEDGGEWE